jgi:hypothetical protein
MTWTNLRYGIVLAISAVMLTTQIQIQAQAPPGVDTNEFLYLNGYRNAHSDYKTFLATQQDTGFTGAPHSLNYSHIFSEHNTTDIHGQFAQGYYGFFGMNDNYTKTHDLKAIRIIQYQTPDGAIFEKEGIIFANGTEITIPTESIGMYHGQPIFGG